VLVVPVSNRQVKLPVSNRHHETQRRREDVLPNVHVVLHCATAGKSLLQAGKQRPILSALGMAEPGEPPLLLAVLGERGSYALSFPTNS
jgi:hypothetical protein